MRLEFFFEFDQEAKVFTAYWDDPKGGGITVQCPSFEGLKEAIKEALICHFGEREI